MTTYYLILIMIGGGSSSVSSPAFTIVPRAMTEDHCNQVGKRWVDSIPANWYQIVDFRCVQVPLEN